MEQRDPTAADSDRASLEATGCTERLATAAGRAAHVASAQIRRNADRGTAEARVAIDRVRVELVAARRAFDASH